MIERGNFAEDLRIMRFTANESESIFTYEHNGFTMSANFESGTLIYPEQIRGRERNTTFTAPENFVIYFTV